MHCMNCVKMSVYPVPNLDANMQALNPIVVSQNHISCMQLSKEHLLATNAQIGRKVFSNRQVLKVIVIVNDEALLVGQMQNTNETV